MEKRKRLTDRLGRPLKDLRISVTDKCNFRCTYCMPKEIFGPDYPFLKKNELLSFEEITTIAGVFAAQGVEKLRITGGEPLMRRELHRLVAKLRKIPGIRDIALTTNGTLLPKQASSLKEAGLQRVTVSLDSLDDERFGRINGTGTKVAPVLKGIEAAAKAGLTVKINMMVRRGVNEEDIVPLARYFKGSGHILRFIEFMDVGNTNGWIMQQVVTREEILSRLQSEFALEPVEPRYYGEVAARYRYVDGSGEIGIISSVSQPFCSTCTRMRLSADGKLYTCLFASNGFDLKSLLRAGAGEAELRERIQTIWEKRNDRYSELRMNGTKKERRKIEMSYIGG